MARKFSDFKSYEGKRYNHLTVISEEPYKIISGRKRRIVKCLCDCGKEITAVLVELQVNRKTSCGCFRNDITLFLNKRIGRLIILSEGERHISSSGKSLRTVNCLCDCGKTTNVMLNALTSKNPTLSCGCLAIETSQIVNKKHGLKDHNLYRKFYGMKTRCYNAKDEHYKDYGGRGIRICDEWLNDFQSFYDWAMANGWQQGLDIDRINNDGNYEPSNCHFVTTLVNNHNRRNSKLSNEDVLDIRNLKMLIPEIQHKEIAQAYKIHQSTVGQILRNEIWQGASL